MSSCSFHSLPVTCEPTLLIRRLHGSEDFLKVGNRKLRPRRTSSWRCIVCLPPLATSGMRQSSCTTPGNMSADGSAWMD